MNMQDANSETYILFEVAGTTYGLSSRSVQQIEMIEHLTPLPNAAPFVEGVFHRRPAGVNLFAASELLCHSEEDVEIRASLGHGLDGLVDFADAAFRVCVGALFFAPDRGGENEVGQLGRGRWMVAILHD